MNLAHIVIIAIFCVVHAVESDRNLGKDCNQSRNAQKQLQMDQNQDQVQCTLNDSVEGNCHVDEVGDDENGDNNYESKYQQINTEEALDESNEEMEEDHNEENSDKDIIDEYVEDENEGSEENKYQQINTEEALDESNEEMHEEQSEENSHNDVIDEYVDYENEGSGENKYHHIDTEQALEGYIEEMEEEQIEQNGDNEIKYEYVDENESSEDYDNKVMFIDYTEMKHNLINFDEETGNDEEKDAESKLYKINEDREEWETLYLHPDYKEALDINSGYLQEPCRDVFMFPLLSEKFCKDLIAEAEEFGDWYPVSDKSTYYEGLPADDLTLQDLGFEKEWLSILRNYLAPIAQQIFPVHTERAVEPVTYMIRYKPTTETTFKPHFDESQITVSLALSRPGEDYEGGSTNFTRYNCDVTEIPVGWVVMYPGSLTHQYQELPITHGTKHVVVSYLDEEH